MIHHITQATQHFLLITSLVGAFFFTSLRIFLSEVAEFKQLLEEKVSAALETKVMIGRLTGSMHGFEPQLLLQQIQLIRADQEAPSISLKEIRITLDLWQIITQGRIFPVSRITLTGTRLQVTRKADGTLAVYGLKAGDEPPLWLLQGNRYAMLDSEVTWLDERRQVPAMHFTQVDIVIDNDEDAQEHRLKIDLQLPEKLGGALQLAMTFRGNPFLDADITGSLYARGKHIQLTKMLPEELPGQLQITSGSSDFKLWSDWQASGLIMLRGEIQAADVGLRAENGRVLDVKHLRSRFHWRKEAAKWRLDVARLDLHTARNDWAGGVFSLAVADDSEQSPRQFGGVFSSLELAPVSELLLFSGMLPAEQAGLLEKLNLSGRLQDFSWFVDLQQEEAAVAGSFQNIGFTAVDGIPEVGNLSGAIKGSNRAGQVFLDSRDALLALPELLRTPVALTRLAGRMDWRQDADHWLLESPLLQVTTADFDSRQRFALRLPRQNAPGFVDWQSVFTLPDAALAKNYLPAKFMDPDLVAWLDQALLAGSISNGRLLIHGELQESGFVGERNIVEAFFDTNAVELLYHPDWPAIQNIDARVAFIDDGLRVDVHHALANGAQVTRALVAIPSFRQSDYLEADIQVSGSIGQSIGFLRQSPLSVKVEPIMAVIEPKGEADIEVKLQIPLGVDLPERVDGVAHLHKARLTVLPLDLPVRKIRGDLLFDENGLYCKKMRAVALGHPLRVSIDNEALLTRIAVQGHAGIDALRKQFPGPWWQVAGGAADYDLQLRVPHAEAKPMTLELSSSLQGLSLDLPETLAKPADQQRPLQMQLHLAEDSDLLLRIDYASRLKAAVKIPEQARQYSGHIVYGEGRAEFRDAPGFRLDADRKRLDLTAWQAFAEAHEADLSGAAAFDLREFHVDTGRLLWKGQNHGPLDLAMAKNGKRWQGTVESPIVKGKLAISWTEQQKQKIDLDAEYLDLTSLYNLRVSGRPLRPDEMPDFDIDSRQLRWRGVDLGALHLQARRIADYLRIERLLVTAPDKKLTLTGSFGGAAQQPSTEVRGKFEVDDLGNFLTLLDVTNDVKDTPATFHFSLQWPGAPYQFSIAEVDGEIQADLGEGRLLGIEPGIGRLLGALDLNQLFRRLRLDFSDLYAAGLAYDDVKGAFRLANGYALTHDLVIDAVAAKIEIRGRTGLVDHSYDQIVTVAPKSTSAIPFAGTIIGFVVEKTFGKHPDRYVRSQYAVKGSWEKPEVVAMHEFDGVLRKAWTGFTSFSWLGKKQKENDKNNESSDYE